MQAIFASHLLRWIGGSRPTKLRFWKGAVLSCRNLADPDGHDLDLFDRIRGLRRHGENAGAITANSILVQEELVLIAASAFRGTRIVLCPIGFATWAEARTLSSCYGEDSIHHPATARSKHERSHFLSFVLVGIGLKPKRLSLKMIPLRHKRRVFL